MTLLDERPRSILRTHEVLYPGLTDDQCYLNLKGVLRRFYQRSIPDAQVRESFWNRSQGPDEPAHQYAADLKVFAEKAFPEMQAKDREMMIRRQFVAGLRKLEAGFKIVCDNVEKMDLCVQIAEYADDLNVIRDDLARRKTTNSSSIALPLSQPRQQYTRPTEQPSPPAQNNGATLNVYNPPATTYTPQSQGYSYQAPTTPPNPRYRQNSARPELNPTTPMACHGCKETGHIRRNCPYLNAQPTNANVNNAPAQPSTSGNGPRTNVLHSNLSPGADNKRVKINGYLLDQCVSD